jgi:hypothetical protein
MVTIYLLTTAVIENTPINVTKALKIFKMSMLKCSHAIGCFINR